jgi:hypothetical protein
MPFAYEDLPLHKAVLITVTGDVDLRESAKAMSEFASRPSITLRSGIVVDLREMIEYPASDGEIRVLAWALRHEQASYDKRLALVLPSESSDDRLNRLRALSDLADTHLAIFSEVDAALAWLASATGEADQ